MALTPHQFVPNDPQKEQFLNFLTQSLWINPDPHMSLPRALRRVATQYGTKEALLDKQEYCYRSIKFQDIMEKSVSLAAALIDMGLEVGSRTALFMRNSSAWVLTDFGTMSAGGITVPIYPTLNPQAVEYILKDSGAQIIFIEDEKQYKIVQQIEDNLPNLHHIVVRNPHHVAQSEKTIHFDDLLLRGTRLLEKMKWEIYQRTNNLKRDDVASIVYTSGTTGFPKGVMLTHMNFLSTVYGTISVTDYNRYDKLLSILPLSHVFERMIGYYAALLSGSSIVYMDSTEGLMRRFQEVQPTMCAAVPRVFEKIYTNMIADIKKASRIERALFDWGQSVGKEIWDLWKNNLMTRKGHRSARLRHRVEDYPDQSFHWTKRPILCFKFYLARRLVFNKVRKILGGKIRYFITGGAPLSANIINFFRNLQIIIYEGYGLTETSPIISFNYGNSFKEKSVGKLISHVNVKFSEEGEILVKGPNVMAGYWNNPEATEEAIDSEGWFHTGDVGKLDDDKFLIITDRIKDLIVLNTGKNVPPLPLEQALEEAELISCAMVLGNNKKYIAALIFPNIPALKKRALMSGFNTEDIESLCKENIVRKWFYKSISQANEPFSSFEQVKRFEIIPYDITNDPNLLTPSLKLKRKAIEEKFGDAIERLYPPLPSY